MSLKTNKIWQLWMGYVVCYIYDGNTCIEPTTCYGVGLEYATEKQNRILRDGKCAWIEKIDPKLVDEVPF